MEAWVLIIAFAFYNADEKMESGSFTIDMPSYKACEERAAQFEEVKLQFKKVYPRKKNDKKMILEKTKKQKNKYGLDHYS